MQINSPGVTAVGAAELRRIKRNVKLCVILWISDILWLLDIGRYLGGELIPNFLVQIISHVPLGNLVLSRVEVWMLGSVGCWITPMQQFLVVTVCGKDAPGTKLNLQAGAICAPKSSPLKN